MAGWLPHSTGARSNDLHASLDSTAIVIGGASHLPRRAASFVFGRNCEVEIERYDWHSIARRFVLVVGQVARIDFSVRF